MTDAWTQLGKVAEFLKAAAPDQWQVGEHHLNEGGGNEPGPVYWAVDELWRDFRAAEDAASLFVETGGVLRDLDQPKPLLQAFATALGLTQMTVDLRKVVREPHAPKDRVRMATFHRAVTGRWQAPLPGLPDYATLDDAVGAVRQFWRDDAADP